MEITDKRLWMRIGASALALFTAYIIFSFALINPMSNLFALIVGGLVVLCPFLMFRKYPLVASAGLFLTAILAFFLNFGIFAALMLAGAGFLAYLSTLNERNRVGRL